MKDGIAYTWDELSEIAHAISNTPTITSDSEEASVTVKGQVKTLKVGQMKKIDGKKVRILGFNHDDLTDTGAYGGTNTKAGISFEYVDFLTSEKMNSSNTNSGGWKASALRGTLNGKTYSSMITTYHIKKVKKDYIPAYNVASTEQTEDYLWLLSCGEIWDNGYKGGTTRGYAITTEGKQYKYYKINLGSTSYSSPSTITRKPDVRMPNMWWLRSPRYHSGGVFCYAYNERLLWR